MTTVRTATLVITATIVLTDAYAGYSVDDLETEISMGMDEQDVTDIGSLTPIGRLSVQDVSMSEPQEVEVYE